MKTDNINSIEIPYHLKKLKKASQYKDKKQVVNPIIRVLKACGIITLICTYFILAFIFYPLLKFKPTWAKAHIIGPILRILSVLVLKTFGYKVNKRGSFSVENGTVVVANHLNAYLDMMLIWSVSKGSFLSTVEVQAMPIFGQMAELAGYIFIDRRTKEHLPSEIEKVTTQCKEGISLILFPEGKCHDGTEVLKFKKPFFTPASSLKKDILIITMNYKSISGKPVTIKNKDNILWYRQQKIVKHMWNLLKFRYVEVELYGDVLKTEEYLKKTNTHIADQANEIVNKRYIPIK